MVDLVNWIVDKIGRMDIFVNNVGIVYVGIFEAILEVDFDCIYVVNVKGVYNGMFVVIKYMQWQKGGVIFNMVFIVFMIGLFDCFVYLMSKGVVLMMIYIVVCDYLVDNIWCNCIVLACIYMFFVDGFLANNYLGKEVEMFDKLFKIQLIGCMGMLEEVVKLFFYFCFDVVGFIIGINYLIDGGFVNLNI